MHSFTEIIRPTPYLPYWIILIIFIQISLLVYLYIYSPKIIVLPVLALIDKRIKRQLIESRNSFQARLLNLIDIIFYIGYSFLIFYFIQYYQNLSPDFISEHLIGEWQDIALFFLILVCLIIIVFVKKQLFQFVSHLFDDTDRYYIFSFNMSMLLKTTGLLAIPFVVLYTWTGINNYPILYYTYIFTVILYLLSLILSFIELPNKSPIDYVNFILYLCALEIIPILITSKYLHLLSQ